MVTDKEELIKKNALLEKEVIHLREINRNKSLWFALLAHDFKNIFANTIWLANALKEKSISIDMLPELLPDLGESAKRNLNALQDTFSAAEIQLDLRDLPFQEINCLALFQVLKEHFQEALQKKELTFIYQGDEVIHFSSNYLLIRSLLVKIIDNAIKFSNPGNKVIFEVSVTEDRKTKITIQDFGVGMSNNTLKDMFTLNRSPYPGTLDELGTGFGLVLVKEIINIIDATIDVESIENIGTSFHVVI